MNLAEKIQEMKNEPTKLLLILGGPGSGKSKLIREYSQETGVPIIDLDKIFSNTPADKLLDEMKDFLSTYHQNVLLIDNKKVLYSKDNSIDLLAFLKEIATDIPVVATWNGKIEDHQLFHIRSDAEDLIYPVSDDFKYIVC